MLQYSRVVVLQHCVNCLTFARAMHLYRDQCNNSGWQGASRNSARPILQLHHCYHCGTTCGAPAADGGTSSSSCWSHGPSGPQASHPSTRALSQLSHCGCSHSPMVAQHVWGWSWSAQQDWGLSCWHSASITVPAHIPEPSSRKRSSPRSIVISRMGVSFLIGSMQDWRHLLQSLVAQQLSQLQPRSDSCWTWW